jgi:hypothetical protein
MTVVLKGSIAEHMAKQTVQAWVLALTREFVKAGATAAHATFTAMIMVPDRINIEHQWTLLQFAGVAFFIRGIMGALAFLEKDPVPLDEEPLG